LVPDWSCSGMSSLRHRSRRVGHILIGIVLITLATMLWSHRVKGAHEADEFAPTPTQRVLLPAATSIEAMVINGIVSSAVVGDDITAFVSRPVVFNGRLAIPRGAQLKGSLESVSILSSAIKVQISFTGLATSNKFVPIHAKPVEVIAPAQSDIRTLGSGLQMLWSAAIGAGIGAASGSARIIERGLLDGSMAAVSVQSAVAVTIVLTADLEI